jgi:hypothetical protein
LPALTTTRSPHQTQARQAAPFDVVVDDIGFSFLAILSKWLHFQAAFMRLTSKQSGTGQTISEKPIVAQNIHLDLL